MKHYTDEGWLDEVGACWVRDILSTGAPWLQQTDAVAGFDLSDEKGREYLAVAQDPNAEDAERARAIFRLHMFPRFWDEVLAEAAKPNQPGWFAKALGMEAFSILTKCGLADDEHFDQLDPHVAAEARLMANEPPRRPPGFMG